MCPPISWLHQPYPILLAVAVKHGWNFKESQDTKVSPEKPIG
jgi:hypothetical protein